MTPTSFATEQVRQARRYDTWREWFRPVFELTADADARRDFRAEAHLWPGDGLVFGRLRAPAAMIERSAASLRRNGTDHWVLTLCRRGAVTVATDRGEFQAAPGTPFLWSLGEPSRTRRAAVDQIFLYLSRDRFRDSAALLDEASGSALATPLGAVLGDFMRALDRRLPSLSEDDVARVSPALGALLAACVAPSPERLAMARASIAVGQLERARQVVRAHLRSPALGPALLGRLLGVSRSSLYRLFEPMGGVARYVQAQRLAEAYAVLCDPAGAQSIARLADDLCFADPSSFSRAFRRAFGRTPGDVRAAALAGSPPVPARAGRGVRAVSFEDVLRGR